MSEGVTLQFVNIKTGEEAHLIFNVNLTYQRTRGNHKAGDPLPKNHFWAGKRSGFVKFWSMTGLEMPTSLSRFHKRMGKLKTVLVSFKVGINGKGINSTISMNQDINRTLKRHKEDIRKTLEKDIKKPSKPNSEKVLSSNQLRVSETTVKRNKVEGTKGNPLSPSKLIPEDQSRDDWLADYEDNQFSGGLNFNSMNSN